MKSPVLAMSHSQSSRRKLFFISSLTLISFFFILASLQHSRPLRDRFAQFRGSRIPGTGVIPLRRRVAVASDFSQHFDVHLAAAHTLSEVLGSSGDIRVFANTPLRHGFQDVVDALDLYPGDIQGPDGFIDAVNSDDSYIDEPGAMIDLVIFGTCEVE